LGLPTLEPAAAERHLRGEIRPVALLDEPPGQERARGVLFEPREQRLGRQGRLVPQGHQDRARRGMGDAGRIDEGQERGPRLGRVQHQLAEIPFVPRHIRHRRGGGRRTIRDPTGVHGVFVNGVEVFDGRDYRPVGKGPGQVLDRFLPARVAPLASAAQ